MSLGIILFTGCSLALLSALILLLAVKVSKKTVVTYIQFPESGIWVLRDGWWYKVDRVVSTETHYPEIFEWNPNKKIVR